jgi:hypothetical protein
MLDYTLQLTQMRCTLWIRFSSNATSAPKNRIIVEISAFEFQLTFWPFIILMDSGSRQHQSRSWARIGDGVHQALWPSTPPSCWEVLAATVQVTATASH